MKILLHYFSLASALLVLLTACEPDAIEQDPSAGNHIKSEIANGRITAAFVYNSQGRIAEWQSTSHYVRYLYDDEGRLIKSEFAIDPATLSSAVYSERTTLMTAGNSTISRYQTFGYDADGKLTGIEDYTERDGDFSLSSQHSLEYEGDRIVRVNIHNQDGQIMQFRTYGYDTQGNVHREQHYSYLLTATPTLISEFVYEYDDKHNPFSVFEALGNPGLYTNPNNIVRVRSVLEDISGPEETTVAATEYVYNQQGYPVKVITENSAFEYTY